MLAAVTALATALSLSLSSEGPVTRANMRLVNHPTLECNGTTLRLGTLETLQIWRLDEVKPSVGSAAGLKSDDLGALALARSSALDAAQAVPKIQLNGHALRLDDGGKILGWMEKSTAMDRLVTDALGFMMHDTPVAPNGLKAFYTYPVYPLRDYPHEPVTLFTRWCWAAAAFFVYSGGDDTLVLEGARMLEYLIANGTTPDDPNWAWRKVPFASSDGGALRYRGASGQDHYRYACSWGVAPPGLAGYRNLRCTVGHGDGYGVLETDKVAAAGSTYVLYWKLTARPAFLDAALACAAALVSNIAPGNATHSPWPFRVYAETGIVREAYTSHVIAAVQLFDELMALGSAGHLPAGASLAGVAEARAAAWAWMMAYPMQNQAWCNFCEDIPVQHITAEIMKNGTCNYNSITPMRVAQYMLQNAAISNEWRTHVPALIHFIEEKLVRGLNRTGEPSVFRGANTVSEQVLDTDKMSCHTVRYATTLAMWADVVTADTGSSEATREAVAKAQRSWDWSSYTLGDDGIVAVTPYTTGEHDMWFNIQVAVPFYTLAMMGANPLWSPHNATHMLRSTSVVTRIALVGGALSYTTFDARATDRLRIAPGFLRTGRPDPVLTVTAAGRALPRLSAVDLQRGAIGWAFDEASGVLGVAHNASNVRVLGGVLAIVV
jgi:hypothetical protein